MFVHASVWDKLLYDERQGILGFPAREFDDLNDAFVQALNRLWPYTAETSVEKTEEDQLYADYLQSLKEEAAPTVVDDDWRNVL